MKYSNRNFNAFHLPLILGIVLFVVINILSTSLFSNLRLDLTKNKIYTLSQGTENILANLEENLSMKLFYSEKIVSNIPQLNSYASRVKNILKRYVKLSDNKIQLSFIDVEAFSEQEDQAVEAGIKAVPIDRAGNNLYFGLLIQNSVDEQQNIAFFDLNREIFLEYDLTRAIYDVTNINSGSIGLINGISAIKAKDSNNMMPGQQQNEEWTILKQLEKKYAVQKIAHDASTIDKNINILLIIHPNNLSQDTLYAIDQYVLAGGKALIFVDPHLEIRGQTASSSNLEKLFSAWGVELVKDKIIADRTNGVQVGNSSGYSRPISKLNWLQLSKKYINQVDLITSELNNMYVISPGSLKYKSDPQLTVNSLLTSSAQSSLINYYQAFDPSSLLRNFIPSNKKFDIALRLNGKLKTAFSERTGDKHISQSQEDTNIIIVADVDMLRDQFWVRKQSFFGQEMLTQISDNSVFVNNALDKLQGNTDLISLRGRKPVEYPFKVVQKLKRAAEKNFLQEEEKLKQKLSATENKIAQLQKKQDGGTLMLNQQQTIAVNNYRQEMVHTRKQLRKVQHSLNTEIDNLGTLIKFLNILLLPLLILMLSLFIPRLLGIKKS